MESLGEKDRAAHLFQKVSAQCADGTGGIVKYVHWQFNGQSARKPFWCWACACSHGTVDKYKDLLKHGHCCPPPPLPKMPGRKSDTKKYEVDAYFVKLHRELGDTMPTPEKPDVSLSLDGEENALIEDVHVLCNLAIEVGG
eukprot:977484-Pyramimonas_sp.AAC.1